MRKAERETTDDEDEKRSTRQAPFGAKNTDEKDEDITSGSDTSHNEHEVLSQTEGRSLSSSYDDESSSEAETIDSQYEETDTKNLRTTDSSQHILCANLSAHLKSHKGAKMERTDIMNTEIGADRHYEEYRIYRCRRR